MKVEHKIWGGMAMLDKSIGVSGEGKEGGVGGANTPAAYRALCHLRYLRELAAQRARPRRRQFGDGQMRRGENVL